MKAYFFACPWLTLPLLMVLLVGGFFGASTLLTTCDTRRPGELTRRQQRHVEAQRDSSLARAARYQAQAEQAATHAAAAYDSTKKYNDTLTYLREHETDVIHIASADTARLQQLWSDVFDH